MAQKEEFTDEKGYLHSTSAHRNIAYELIYKKNLDKYPLPFRFYVVHHVDGDKTNNDPKNLQIMTSFEHAYIHGYITEKELEDIFFEKEEEKEVIPEPEPETQQIIELGHVDLILNQSYEPLDENVIDEKALKTLIEEAKTQQEVNHYIRMLKYISEEGFDYDNYFWIKNMSIYNERVEKIKNSFSDKDLIKELKEHAKILQDSDFKAVMDWEIAEDKRLKKNKNIMERNRKLKKKKEEYTKLREKLNKKEDKEYYCSECNRKIKQKGKCLPCNKKAKKEREINSDKKRFLK